ncbi:cell division peptidoglycan polymerase FtsW [Streptococcus sp. DD13]|uniref:cell division peptidoglycan polymerase FtsW n=1 Tax=Streptococcus sp. DD13 TaxID=1777881 RepID=UPI00079A0B65|nr:FtsW/RodA/SpoVE family cell cycle protein [Streptococcus sp. DD13]KXT78578.1 Cell division protein FtsW [Streptococcus sp. DD13]
MDNQLKQIDKRHFLNYSILIPYLILSIIGLIMVYSTTSAVQIRAGRSAERSFVTQAAFWGVSLIGIFIIYRMRLSFLRRARVVNVAILVEILLLIASRFFTPVNGAYGWISFGAFTMQPAEYLKLIIVWFLAYKFSAIQKDISIYDYQALTKGRWIPNRVNDWRLVSLILLLLVASLPDLGNATIIALTILIMVSVSGVGHRWFSVILGAVVGISTIVLGSISILGVKVVERIPVFGYVAKRFEAFYNPFVNQTSSGLQLSHSYYAMSNGGWFGRGLGNSVEKNGYLPEAHTDFAFSITIEELGLIGASLILAILFFLILRIIIVGIRARNPFNAMMALGVAGMLLIQTFVNIGGISGLIPATGVTFPFISQGGSSLLIISIAIGFVLNIDANEKRDQLQRELEFGHRVG